MHEDDIAKLKEWYRDNAAYGVYIDDANNNKFEFANQPWQMLLRIIAELRPIGNVPIDGIDTKSLDELILGTFPFGTFQPETQRQLLIATRALILCAITVTRATTWAEAADDMAGAAVKAAESK